MLIMIMKMISSLKDSSLDQNYLFQVDESCCDQYNHDPMSPIAEDFLMIILLDGTFFARLLPLLSIQDTVLEPVGIELLVAPFGSHHADEWIMINNSMMMMMTTIMMMIYI